MRSNTNENQRTQYLLQHFGHETELHRKIVEKSLAENVLGMQVSAYEGQMLQFFTQVSGAKKIVEIGCLYGYSALWMLDVLPSDGKLFLLEMDASRVDWMKESFKSHPKFSQIVWCVGDARESLSSIKAEAPFDLCFIDANKAAYSDYLTWAESHVRNGGLILGDNSFLWGEVYTVTEDEKNIRNQVKAMKEFNARLADRSRYLGTLIPTEEGLTVAQKLF